MSTDQTTTIDPLVTLALDALDAASEASRTAYNDERALEVARHLTGAAGKLVRASHKVIAGGVGRNDRLTALGHAMGLTNAAVAFVRRYPDLTATMGGEMIQDAREALVAEFGN